MVKIYTPIQLDVAFPNKTQTIDVMQGDQNSRILVITLLNNGVFVNASEGLSAVLNGVTSNGEAFSTNGTINANGTITMPISDWMVQDSDRIICTISINGQSNEKITTFPLIVKVHQTMAGRENLFTATDDDILLGKTAYANGETLVGTIQTYDGETTITEPGTIETAGKYVPSNIEVDMPTEEDIYQEINSSQYGDTPESNFYLSNDQPMITSDWLVFTVQEEEEE